MPSGHSVKKTLTLASIMWATLFLIPFLKYPANPPTVGDPETIVLRSAIYLGFIALSGFGALGFYKVYKKLLGKKKILAFAGYTVYITVIFALMPPNPDEITAPMELVNGFRYTSFVAVTIFWIANAIILGMLWQKYNLDKKLETKIS